MGAAENNLKRADELRRQQERQLANLQKQAEEAAKYKSISEEIKKVEAGLYYLRLLEIDNEIKVENEINNEADDQVKSFNDKLEDLSMKIIEKNKNVNPIREKNQENLSKIQRLNLELKSLDEEKDRVNDEIQSIRKALGVIDEDIVREKSIIIDANSNEKRLREEKENLITVDSKYYETEKLSGLDLVNAKGKLKDEQDKLERILENLNLDTLKKLPPEVAKIIIEEAKVYELAAVKDAQLRYEKGLKDLVKFGKKKGINDAVTYLPVAQQKIWAETIKDWPNSRAADITKGYPGIDGAALMNVYMEEVEKTGHKFPVRYKIGG